MRCSLLGWFLVELCWTLSRWMDIKAWKLEYLTRLINWMDWMRFGCDWIEGLITIRIVMDCKGYM
jgi:hypothetical protein